MSKATPTALISSSSNLQAIFEASLKEYEKKTEKSLVTHPLMTQLQACNNSPVDILALLRSQAANVEQTTSADDKLIKWLDPIVNVLSASSSVISAGVGLVFSPANVIFAGAGVLLSAAKDVMASQDALITIFERIESFFRRLEEYAEVPMTDAMKDIMVKIMVEVLEIFAIMTKEIRQGRAKRHLKKFFKKLIGRKGIEDALSKLDRLTQEEVNMAAVQILKVAHHIKGGVEAVGVEVKGVGDNVNQLIEDGKKAKARMEEEKQRRMIKECRSRVRTDRAWLSPPDPSTNLNFASSAQHERTATWFFEGSISKEWKSKSTTSLLWIHGKPGSGKSVLCSAVIQDITALQEAGKATMAYFYFDFRDTDKQNLQNALPSLLTQLSARSDSCCDILSHVYEAHNNGAYKPSTGAMITCLKEMLALPDQGPFYIILDAIDECPNTSGIPSARKKVLDFLKDLVGLQLPNLHICVTSRPEIDIRTTLEPLASYLISIHDQYGQKKDIEDYIRAVVYADSDTAMGRWRNQDKELVIKTLTERADGMFRWVFCQLEVLQHCFPQSIRRSLKELPKSLDETYERILKEIGMSNRDHARRLLQCLAVAIRPLRVDELAEILALDFDGTEEATPTLNKDWRSEDRQRAVLSACSSLITLAGNVIQFSHFSVQEFLTSDRLFASKSDASQFHIMPEPAHTTLAQACLGTLLQLDGSLKSYEVNRSFPLAEYASQNWVDHAQFGVVSSRIEHGLRCLFDSAKPHFAAWIQLRDIDTRWPAFVGSTRATARPTFGVPPLARPLYYASLFGFRDLAAHIIFKHPEQVNARGGCNHSPLVAALYRRHFDVAEVLCQHGAAVDVLGLNNRTPLLAAVVDGFIDIVQWLVDHGADTVSHDDDDEWDPILTAAACGSLEVVRILLGHGVRVNAADSEGRTPLHVASSSGYVEIVTLLLQHGADTTAQDADSSTPLHLASSHRQLQVLHLLLDHDADLGAENREGRTPLHLASSKGDTDIARLLLDSGASIDAEDKEGRVPLHLASFGGNTDTTGLLLDLGADLNAADKEGSTPLHLASSRGDADTTHLLLDRGANVNAEDRGGSTPLHLASSASDRDTTHLLLDRGANINAEDNEGWTPLHLASSKAKLSSVRLLCERGANINAVDQEGWTPLHLASSEGNSATGRLLLDLGANANAKDKDGWTPLHLASSKRSEEIMDLLLDGGANANAEDKEGWTPLHLASSDGYTEIVRLLLDRGANANAEDKEGWTPLHLASSDGHTTTVRLLLDRGASADVTNKKGRTPLQVATTQGMDEIIQVLAGHGAQVDREL